MKLKTLKDIEKETAIETGLNIEDVLVNPEVVRIEAVKWVKAKDDEVPNNCWTFEQRFKHFFNITEEDLK